MRILGLGSPDKVPPLTEKAAMDLGGEVLGDAIVLLVAAGIILIEVSRQSSNKNTKENAMLQKLTDIEAELSRRSVEEQDRISELKKEFQSQLNDLNSRLEQLSSQTVSQK